MAARWGGRVGGGAMSGVGLRGGNRELRTLPESLPSALVERRLAVACRVLPGLARSRSRGVRRVPDDRASLPRRAARSVENARSAARARPSEQRIDARVGLAGGAVVRPWTPGGASGRLMRLAILGTRGIPARYGGFRDLRRGALGAACGTRALRDGLHAESPCRSRRGVASRRSGTRLACAPCQGARDALTHDALVPRRVAA